MNQYVCIKKCFFNNRLWEPGDGKVLNASSAPANVFREIKLDSPGMDEDDKSVIMKRQIKDALMKLDLKNHKHWISDGRPSMQAVEKALGFNVSRRDVDDAWPGFNRNQDIKTLSSAKKGIDFMD